MIRLQTGQRTLLFALGVGVLALAAFGLSRLAQGGGGRTVQTSTVKAAIPPIDAAQPAGYETATFALG